VLSAPVVKKLGFIHEIVHAGEAAQPARRRGFLGRMMQAAPPEQPPAQPPAPPGPPEIPPSIEPPPEEIPPPAPPPEPPPLRLA
jgi:hypothetical protein